MTGNIENAAQILASALVYLADKLANALTPQPAKFFAAPTVPPNTWTIPAADPVYPYGPNTTPTPAWPNTYPRITCGDVHQTTCSAQADGAGMIGGTDGNF